MNSKDRDYRDYLDDILENIDLTIEFTKGYSYETFFEDRRTSQAIIRNLEVIGEAANKIPDTIKADFSEIPWHKIRGLRNRVAHEYFGIDLKMVWAIATQDLPPLKPIFEKIRKSQ